MPRNNKHNSFGHLAAPALNTIRTIVAVGLFSLCVPLPAANVWDGGGADNNWGTAANWDDNLVPAAGAALSFSNSVRLIITNNTVGRTVAGITFVTNGAPNFTLNGNAITLTGDIGFSANNSGIGFMTETINLDITLGSSRTVSTPNGGNGAVIINGNISGGFSLIKGQLGTLTLAGGNGFTGALDLRAGIVSVNSLASSGVSSAIGAGNVIFFGGPAGASTTTLNYTGTNTASTSVNRTIALSSSSASAGGVINNNSAGALIFNGVFTNNPSATGTKSFTLGGSNSGGNDFQCVVSNGSPIAGVSLTKADSGIWILSRTNTYTGPTAVNGGTLLVNGAVGTNIVTVASGATLGGTGTIGGNVTFAAGAFALFTNGGTLTISGSLTVNSNVVRLNLPANVSAGTYLLATYKPTSSSGLFADTPLVVSGSFAPFTTNYITAATGQVNLVVQNLPMSYLTWANYWGLDTSVGADTNDVDGDGYANLYEYAVGGNPTNSADWGQSPAFGLGAGGMQYVYPRRSDDTNLIYSLQTTKNLAPAQWTNTGYIVTGTNVTGGVFNYVTNLIPTTNVSGFVRLAVDYPDCLAAFVPIPYVDFVVTNYGATGNGVSDDTVAIQAAINAADVSGGVVWFPSGVYRITAPLVLSSGRVSLIGRASGELPCASIIKAGVSMPAMLVTSNVDNIAIESLVFDGGADQGCSISCALDLQDFLGSRVGQVGIRNVTGDGIWSRWVQSLAGYSWVNWFVNLDISVGGYAIRLGSSDSWVQGVNVTGGLGISEELNSGNVYRNCVFCGCTNGISNTNQSGNNLRFSVTGCAFINNSKYGLAFSFPVTNFDTYNTVDGCVFEGNGEADVFLGNASRVALRKNEFRTVAPSRGQAIYTSGTLNYVTATDNRFALASQTLPGNRSVLASNIFSCAIWDSTAGVSVREDLILFPTGGTLRNVMNAPYNAAGNGSADDTAELQAALNAANPGDTVYFPEGAYKITQPLQLTKSGILLLGDGRSTSGGSRIIAGTNLASMLTTTTNVTGLRMAKLNLIGGATYAVTNYAVTNALLFSQLTDSRLDFVTVMNANGNAFVLGTNSARVTLRNCHAQKPVGFGIILEGTNCAVDACYVSGVSLVTPYGIEISGAGGHQIISTHVDDETTVGILLTNPAPNNAAVTISNCYFDCGDQIPPNAAIAVDYSQPHAANLSVEACLFRSNGVDLKLNNATHVSWESSTSSVRSAGQGGTVHLQTSGSVDYLNIIGNVFGNTISVPGANSVVYGNATP